ncbi:MAG: ABC transporter ATP-binding protein [Candidatus Bipolaricaulota bacterium]|nr:MAG: ABC transporter ATP-binding protein [Candidatus Bipolaricaulota bacterium]
MLNDRESLGFRVVRLCFGFRDSERELRVLEDLSFDVRGGEFLSIVGPSGCGKTTLLRLLAGLLEPDSGDIDVVDAASPLRVAYLPQRETLLPWRSALSNAVLASDIAGRPRHEALREARKLFVRFGLSGFEDHYPSQLSGGMRQRLAIVRTFLAHREVLLLDEPFGALDPLTRASLQDWLIEVWQALAKTVVLVTHDAEEALLLSDRLLVLSPRPASARSLDVVSLGRPRVRSDRALMEARAALLERLLEEEGT